MTTAASANGSSTAAARDARGRFQPGCSGNPAGKKPGTLNRATILRRVMDERDEERIGCLILERALKGDWAALRFVHEQLEPKPRTRPVALDFPEHATVAEMAEIVLRAVAEGAISPDEALKLMQFLDQIENYRCKAWASAAVHGQPIPATRPTVVRQADPPAAPPAPDLHSASIATSPPSSSSPHRRRAATAATAAALASSPQFGARVAGANGRADGLHSTSNSRP